MALAGGRGGRNRGIMSHIAIVDYGMGNLHSVARALEHVAGRTRVIVTQNPRQVLDAARVVFPGQGAIGVCRQELERLGMLDAVRRSAAERPFFGMCLGPQVLMDFSEEDGGVRGLGVIPGQVRRFPATLTDGSGADRLKIPHMGWNRVHQHLRHPLWNGIGQDAWFYFVHSYYLDPADHGCIAGSTEYGLEFASAVAAENVFAVQFHPEKSAADGLRLLANFVGWQPG